MIELINAVLTEQTKILFIIVVVILILEMASGVLAAIKNKELDSTKFRDGLLSKSGYFLQIGLVLLVSIMISIPYLMYAELLWVACSEGVSVVENISKMGVPIPDFVKNILEKTKKTTEDSVENKTK